MKSLKFSFLVTIVCVQKLIIWFLLNCSEQLLGIIFPGVLWHKTPLQKKAGSMKAF
jgi:hypothetical protein